MKSVALQKSNISFNQATHSLRMELSGGWGGWGVGGGGGGETKLCKLLNVRALAFSQALKCKIS